MLVYLHRKESDCWDWIVYANRWQHFSVGNWHNIIKRCGIGLVPRRLPSCEGLVGGILMSSSAESQRQWRKCIHLRLVDDVNVDHFTCYQTFPVKWILEFILYWVPTKLTARCYPLSIELAVSPKGETCVFNWRGKPGKDWRALWGKVDGLWAGLKNLVCYLPTRLAWVLGRYGDTDLQ